MQYQGNYMEMKVFNYVFEIDILRNSSHFKKFLTIFFGCFEGCFSRVWVSKRRPDALLAKTVSGSFGRYRHERVNKQSMDHCASSGVKGLNRFICF